MSMLEYSFTEKKSNQKANILKINTMNKKVLLVDISFQLHFSVAIFRVNIIKSIYKSLHIDFILLSLKIVIGKCS